MSKTSHTPGPWQFLSDKDIQEKENDRYHIEPVDPSFNVNLIGEVYIFDKAEDKEIALANAQLIATAPDLLAACHGLLELLDRLGRNESTEYYEQHPAYKAAGVAICKAEGRS